MKRYIQQLVRIYALIKIKEGNTNYYYPSNRLNFIKKPIEKIEDEVIFCQECHVISSNSTNLIKTKYIHEILEFSPLPHDEIRR